VETGTCLQRLPLRSLSSVAGYVTSIPLKEIRIGVVGKKLIEGVFDWGWPRKIWSFFFFKNGV
jgi:hypothetical protein